MPKDILIIVNCELPLNSNNQLPSNAVQMFSADPNIVQNGSQGTTELWINVPPETNLRWRAVPLQITDLGNNPYQVLITQVQIWGSSPSNNQLDAWQYLQQWFADAGSGTGVSYAQATQAIQLTDPAPGTASTSNPIPVANQTLPDPFVQAITTNPMPAGKNKVAYSFICTVYKNGAPYATVTWDPYVTVQ